MSTQRASKKQRELLTYIDAFIKTNGYGPSYREVMNAMHYKSVSTVASHIDGLIAKGYLRKRDYSARSLEVVAHAEDASEPTTKITKANAQWLVANITTRFSAVEANPQQQQNEIDNLYVLVGALHILGLEDAARAFKRRLVALSNK